MQELFVIIIVFYININEFFSLKRKLMNDITVYENINVFTQIKTVINDLLHLFENQKNVINMFETEYINIFLLNN